MKTKWFNRVLAIAVALCLVTGMAPATLATDDPAPQTEPNSGDEITTEGALQETVTDDDPTTVGEDSSSPATPVTEEDDPTAQAETDGDDSTTPEKALRAAVANGGTVTLDENITLTATLTIEKGTVVTLDLNGNTLTGTGDDTITNYGELTIEGTGTITNTVNGKTALLNNGTAALNGGTFIREDVSGNSYYTVVNHGTMTVDGATISNTGSYASCVENGWDVSDGTTAKMTLVSGTISGGLNALKNDSGGVLEVQGGTITNSTQYAIMNWNEATISGGTITCTAVYNSSNGIYPAAIYNQAGEDESSVGQLIIDGGEFTTTEGSTYALDNRAAATISGTAVLTGGSSAVQSTGTDAVTTISGGTLVGTKYYAVTVSSGSQVKISAGSLKGNYYVIRSGTGAEVDITGGTFTNTAGAATVHISNSATVNISGGEFSGSTKYAVNNSSGQLTISDGKFTSPNSAVYVGKDESAQTTILGGDFTTTTENVNTVTVDTKGTLAVSGGTFISGSSADTSVTAYLADDSLTVDENGKVVSSAATSAVAQIVRNGETITYTTLAAAIDAAQAGETVTLLEDICLEETVTIPENKEVTLDLDGHNITVFKDESTGRSLYAIDNYGTFTLKDSVGSGAITARGIENLGSGVMTIESGSIVSCDSNGGAAIWNEANLTVNGGTFETLYVGTPSDSIGVGCLNNSGTALITGGTFKDVNRRTYAIISTGKIEITPAEGKEVTVHGAHGGLAIDSGTAVVNGGSFSSTDYYGLYVSNDGMGEDPETAAVTVNDGTFSGKSYSVWVGSDYNDPVNSTIEIKGGTFNNPLNAQNVTGEDAITISGGEFSAEVPLEFCADGYIPSAANVEGKYTVEGGSYVAAICGSDGTYSGYTSLTDAITAANSNDTITLLANVTESVTVPADKVVTLDLNGKTVKSSSYTIKVDGGKLTVKDSTVTAAPVVSDDYETVTYTSGKVTSSNYAAIQVLNGGSLTVASGTVSCSDGYGAVYVLGNSAPGGGEAIASTATVNGGYIEGQEFGITVRGNGAALTVTDGVIVSKDNAAVGGNGANNNIQYYGGTTMNISGGTLIGHIVTLGYIACGIYHPQDGVLNITGGTIYADGGVGVLMRGGELNMTGGEVIASGSTSGKVGDSTIIANCYGILLDGAAGYYDIANTKVDISENASVSAEAGVDALMVTDKNGATGIIAVSGGTFSSEVPEEYCADGFEPVTVTDENGMYTVQETVAAVAQIGEKTYPTLDEAIEAVQPGDTITLLGNVTLVDDTPAKIMDKGTADSPITLDLNGYTISGSNSKNGTNEDTTTPGGILWVYGSYVTLTDTSNGDEKGGIVNTYVGSSAAYGLVIRSTESNVGAVTIERGVRIDVTGSTSTSARAIHFQNNTNTSGMLTLTIENAKVTANKGYTVYASGLNGMVTINGGEFASTGKGNNDNNFYGSTTTMTINGGTFYNWGNTAWNEVAQDHVICIAQPEENGTFTVTIAAQAPDDYVALVDAVGSYRVICLTEGSDLYAIHNIQNPGGTNGSGRTIHVKKDVSYIFPDGKYYGYSASNDPGSYLLTLDLAEGVTLSGGMNLWSADVTVTGAGRLEGNFAWTPATGFEMTANGETNGLYSCRLTTGAQAELIKADGTTVLYNTVGGAIVAARQNPGSTAKMLADYTNSGQVMLNLYNNVVADFTLDLNGHTYTYSGVKDAITVDSGAKLIVTDSSETGGGAIITKGTRGAANSAIATTGTGGTIIIGEGVTVKNLVLLDAPNSKLTVAGTIDTTGFETYAISGNGSTGKGGTEITIKATAEIISDPDVAAPAIYHPQSGTLTVEGGTISGYGGIQMCSGDLVITGNPKITATGSDNTANKTGDGGIPDGAAISIVDRNYPGGAPTATITGNPTVTATSGVDAVQAYTWSNSEKNEWAEAGDSVNISGGTYSTEPKETLLAEGYVANLVEDGSGNYIVKEGDEALNTATNESGTLATLLANATTGQTVKLLRDVTAENISVRSGITLDLNGQTLEVSEAVTSFGQVKDSSNGTGVLVTSALTLSESNEQLPIFVSNDNGYHFVNFKFQSFAAQNGTEESVEFWCRVLLDDAEIYNYLRSSNKHGLKVSMHVSVDGYEDTLDFVYTDSMLDEYAESIITSEKPSKYVLYLKLTGLQSFSGATVKGQPKLESTSAIGFEVTAKEITYTVPGGVEEGQD